MGEPTMLYEQKECVIMSNPGIKMRSFSCRVPGGGFWQPAHEQPTQEKSEHSQRRIELSQLNACALMGRECLPMAEVEEHIRPDPEEYKVTLALIRSVTSACAGGANLKGEMKKITTHLDQVALIKPIPRHCLHIMDEAFQELMKLMERAGLNRKTEWFWEAQHQYFEVFKLH